MQKAANFTLPDQHNNSHSLGDYSGRWLVLYFYPKDNTPGCTQEACLFRDGRDLLSNEGAEVVGVSQDSAASHQTFANDHNLNFTLLSDEEGSMMRTYGAINKDGKLERKTFLINPDGEIAKEYPSVDPAQHVTEVLSDLRRLTSEHISTQDKEAETRQSFKS